MRVLIVDSQPLIRRGIVHVLTMHNVSNDIYEAGSIAEAMKMLQNKNIHLAIIGINFRKDDTFDLIAQIKKNLYRDLKIILLTSSTNLEDFIKVKDLGIEGYLLKNVDVDDLLYSIKVVKKGGKYFSSHILEMSMEKSELKEINNLTEREKEVFELLCKGLSNGEIGKSLYITEATAKKHISNILTKLNLSNRVEAIFYANKLYDNQMIV